MTEEIFPYYKPPLKIRAAMTFGMFGLLAVFVVWLFAYLPTEMFILGVSLFALYMAPGAGKESIIPVMMGFGFPWWLVLIGIVMIDMTLAVLFRSTSICCSRSRFSARYCCFSPEKQIIFFRENPGSKAFP